MSNYLTNTSQSTWQRTVRYLPKHLTENYEIPVKAPDSTWQKWLITQCIKSSRWCSASTHLFCLKLLQSGSTHWANLPARVFGSLNSTLLSINKSQLGCGISWDSMSPVQTSEVKGHSQGHSHSACSILWQLRHSRSVWKSQEYRKECLLMHQK